MTQFYGTRLTCKECGHSHVAKGGVGKAHLQACFHCGTDDPSFDRESVYR